jgi:hypothetical protein
MGVLSKTTGAMMKFLLIGCCLFFAGSWAKAGAEELYVASGFSRRTIYHSPQKPGYTAWVGAWFMPDKSIMVCFTQASGPVQGREPGSRELREKLEIPVAYDFTGLDLREIYLRSTDGGDRWSEVGFTSFQGMGASAYAGGATMALADGTILRRVNGWDLMQDPHIPHTAYLQRSQDGAKTWGAPQVLLDPAHFLYQISRIRPLRDGRLIATGQFWPAPASSTHKELSKIRPNLLLMTSEGGGKSWKKHDVVPAEHRDVAWDEWDQAQLPSGDLLCVFRRGDPKDPRKEVRWQGVLVKKGKSWELERFHASMLPHSGHPELLATREGIILHIATTGMHWTADAGKTWTPLEAPGFGGAYKSRYYPRALQAEDGRIYVFGHNGSDNPYGAVDQSIDMDVFRIERRR